MGYEENLKGIDAEIEREYDKLIVQKYANIFSQVVEDSAEKLIGKNIPAVRVGPANLRLVFLQTGCFMRDGKYIYPQKTDEETLQGMLEIARVYNESRMLFRNTKNALKNCLDNLVGSVGEAVDRKQ